MLDFSDVRQAMVVGQLRTNDVTNSELLDAFTLVPRHLFVDPTQHPIAYADRVVTALGPAHRQMLSPMCLGRMIQAAEIKEGMAVLDVAGGAGYSSALLAALGAEVTMLEDQMAQTLIAEQTLKKAGIGGVKTISGEIANGVDKKINYDAILLNGRCELVPESLIDLLVEGGRLVVVMGSSTSSSVRVFTRSDDSFGEKRLMSSYGPLISAFSRVPEFVF